MGKQSNRPLLRKAEAIYKMFPEQFKDDFESNKKFVDGLGLSFSKINRNILVGHITRLVQLKEAS